MLRRDRTRPLVRRLARGAERHSQRWDLQRPSTRQPPEVRRLLVVLATPTLALAFGISILTTYGPVVLLQLAQSPTKVGALIGGEGAFALAVPLLAGALSDRLPRTGTARRTPFIAVGTPLAAAGLLALPFAPSFTDAGYALFAFFVGYYLYYPPYRALYADLLPRELYAPAQAGQALARGAGLGLALLSGGLLLRLWQPGAFVLGAGAVVAGTLVLLPALREPAVAPDGALPYAAEGVWSTLRRSRGLRQFVVANALWEFSFAGLKTFIVLYVVRGLGYSAAVASAVIAVVAVAYVAGAPLAAWLSARFGMVRVMLVAAAGYGTGLCAGVLPGSLAPMLGELPLVALAGAVLLTLPQALAFAVAPAGRQGAAAGLLDFSRGIGLVLGPVSVGAAVAAAAPAFPSTHGYAAMWPVIGLPVLASLPLLRRLQSSYDAAEPSDLSVNQTTLPGLSGSGSHP